MYKNKIRIHVILNVTALILWHSACVGSQATMDENLYTLGLEDLMSIQVTSVSKKPQKFSDSAAAIFVITNKDLLRSGVTSIPEALRMVPGLLVGRIDSNKWAVSSRGFNNRFTKKLLVLIDGRTVYTPSFSGVYWEVQDVLLEDVERIEVIRGPGASLWGANAVNGVINIITKNASDTLGGLLSAGGGLQKRHFQAPVTVRP
jgi:iron complex outermembrane receptor protein